MDDMETCSEGLRDLGEEDVLSSPPPSVIPPSSPTVVGTPMVVDQPQSPLSPQTIVDNTQLDLTLLEQAHPRREPSQKYAFYSPFRTSVIHSSS